MRWIKSRAQNWGFALPIVLIIIALLSVLSMGLSEMARNRMQDIQLRSDIWVDEAAAIDATHQIVYGMLTGDYSEKLLYFNEQTIFLNGEPSQVFGREVKVQDGAGMLGLAFYDVARFRRLLEGTTEKEAAYKISAELGDWIDRDNITQFQGMEAADYVSKSLLQSPRNGPIRSLEELLYLPSMTSEILNGSDGQAGLVDLVLAGGASTFNIATAPPLVLGARLGLTEESLPAVLAAREAGNWPQMKSLINQNGSMYDNENPLVHSNRYVVSFKGINENKIRAQIMLTPYQEDRLFSLIDWRAPFYPSE